MCLALLLGDVETFSLTCARNSTNCSLCNIRAATEYRSPEHVGRVMTCQRTKKVAARCVTCAIFHEIVTPSGANGYFQDWIEAFGHFRACCSDQLSCCDVRSIRARMREYDPFRKCATGLCRTQHDKAMTQHDTHLRGEWHPRCSVRCEIITL